LPELGVDWQTLRRSVCRALALLLAALPDLVIEIDHGCPLLGGKVQNGKDVEIAMGGRPRGLENARQ
jgi:hypothetical protein